ncbi:MAG TPA: DNA polymerase III subunit beta [Elusimicrobiota bacterium]|nr:DNA polymerase III subunit beta [Elusimicrobiota bacterium]
MQIVLSKTELIKGIQTVQSAVSTKSTLPVLSNILMETKTNELKLASTDLEVGVRCLIKAEIVKEGSLTVPAKTFSDFVRTLQDNQEINISTDGGTRMEIRSGKTRCILLGLPKEDFPVLPEFPQENAISLDGKTLQDMIRKTSFSVSTDETRYILNGIYFILKDGTARMVATDGRRLATIARPVDDKKATLAAIIPSKAIREVERLLATEGLANEKIQISITDNQVAFKLGETVIISRLIEGHFPNYEQVIPKSSDIRVQVAAKDLLTMTQRAALGSGDRGGAVRFGLEKNRLKAAGSAQGRVEVEDELPIEYSGSALEISFNPLFVLDVLKNIEANQVILEFTTSFNPGVIRPVGDDQILSVIMPMRI